VGRGISYVRQHRVRRWLCTHSGVLKVGAESAWTGAPATGRRPCRPTGAPWRSPSPAGSAPRSGVPPPPRGGGKLTSDHGFHVPQLPAPPRRGQVGSSLYRQLRACTTTTNTHHHCLTHTQAKEKGGPPRGGYGRRKPSRGVIQRYTISKPWFQNVRFPRGRWTQAGAGQGGVASGEK